MSQVDKILQKLEAIIENGIYEHVETEVLELKDNSHATSQWKEVHKTICAFLNTEGGILILGVHEDTALRKYTVKGFDFRNEEKLRSDIETAFKNEHKARLDVGAFINYRTTEFLEKTLLLIYVTALPDDIKYAFYNGEAYERIMSGDVKISQQKLERQKEYKTETQDARELSVVKGAVLEDLSFEKLNDYIQLLNKEIKTESIKASLTDAFSFLKRQWMVLEDGRPTLLGMLVCGERPGEKLAFRSQVDAYVEDVGMAIARDKKIINDTVLNLMEQSVAFVVRNIQTGISLEQGGTRTYEYPERLIRECVNNSLAHRDYSINQFVSISICPNKYIQIKNPGRFKQQLIVQHADTQLPIRRLIAGSSKANNPKLASILSVFNKWEGKGYGMATLTNACLDDQIDVPYYTFAVDEITLTVPKGRVLDENMEVLFELYSGYIRERLDGDEITEEQKRVLAYLYKSEQRNREDRFTILLTKANNHLQALQTLQEAKLIYVDDRSEEFYPIYITDRQLFKRDLKTELRAIFGGRYDELSADQRNVLRYVYERNKFATDKYPSANDVGSKLWVMNGNANKLEGYEAYKRKVRKIINNLENGGMIGRYEGKARYFVVEEFKEGGIF